jgi:hypothetical protein
MIMPLDRIEGHLRNPDQSLMYHLVIQQQETNRLLTQLVEGKPKEAEAVNIDELNRQELMKEFAKLPNNPKGWNKWQTEDMRKHLKGEEHEDDSR